MFYNVTNQSGNSYTHLWDIETAKQLDGGFLITNAPAGLDIIPRGTLVAVDQVERTAKVVRTAKVATAVTSSATSVKVSKGHNLAKGDVIGINGKSVTLGAITVGTDYDSFTITAGALGELAIGDVLMSYDGTTACAVDGILTADAVVDANPTASVTFAAVGIKSAALPYPVGKEAKAQLPLCHFI